MAGDSKLFVTTGNIGFTTDQIAESDSRTQGVPLLGGGYRNDKLTETTTFAAAEVTIGEMVIKGPIDNSTPLDTGLGWVYRGVRAWITGEVFKSAIEQFYGAKNAEVAAEAGTRGAEIEAGVEGQRIAAEAATEQARIAAEVETLGIGGPLP